VATSNDTDAHSLADAGAVGKASSAKPWETSTNVTGGLTLTFTDNGTNGLDEGFTGDTITRSSGSWTADGFVQGDVITVEGTTSNNTSAGNTYKIGSISSDGLTLTLNTADTLSAEEASGTQLVVAKKAPIPVPTPAPVVTRGGPDIIFADNSTRAGTISLSSGNWLTNGYKKGDTITVVGTNSANDGTYQIADITKDGRVVILTAEGSLASGVTKFSGAAVKVERHYAGLMNGHPQLTFAAIGTDTDPQPDTITRASGSWIVDGFTIGQTINVTGTEHNNKTFSIADISSDGTQLTLAATDELKAETPDTKTTEVERSSKAKDAKLVLNPGADPGPSETLSFSHSDTAGDTISRKSGNWLDDHLAVGDKITVAGTKSGIISNDGTYTIDAIEANGSTLRLVATDKLTNQTGVNDSTNSETTLSVNRSDISDSTEIRFGIGVGVAVNVAVASNKAVIEGDVIETDMLRQQDEVVMRGTPDLLFTQNASADDTITRSSGSWLADGFAVDDVFTIGGDSDNTGVYQITAISGDGLTLTTSGVLNPHAVMSGTPDLTLTDSKGETDERDTIQRGDAVDWSSDGFEVGDTIRLDGDVRNGDVYTIDDISADGLTLYLDAEDELNGYDSAQSGLTVVRDLELTIEQRNEVILYDTTGLVFAHFDSDNNPATDTDHDTITRLDGVYWDTVGYGADRLQIGDVIKIHGDENNNGFYTISEINGATLKLSENDALVVSADKSLTVDRYAPVVMVGSPELMLVDNAGQTDTRDTITRSGGSWSDDGFEVGHTINIIGDSNNTGTYTIDDISEDGLTLYTGYHWC